MLLNANFSFILIKYSISADNNLKTSENTKIRHKSYLSSNSQTGNYAKKNPKFLNANFKSSSVASNITKSLIIKHKAQLKKKTKGFREKRSNLSPNSPNKISLQTPKVSITKPIQSISVK